MESSFPGEGYISKSLFVCLMVFNTTFNNLSVISWRSVLLVEKTTDLLQVTDKLDHIMLYTSPWSRFELITSVVIGTDCIASGKSNYHAIMTTTVPHFQKGGIKSPSYVISIREYFSHMNSIHVSINTNIEIPCQNLYLIIKWQKKRYHNTDILY